MRNQRPLFVVAILLAVTFSILNDAHAGANETDLQGIDDQSIFSSTFLAELGAADRAGPPKLEAIYRKFVSPAEQAEIELTIAQIYSQRTGMVDPAKAVEWYNKALVRGLPLTALAKHLILRGNMHERLGHDEKAMADYVRGLLICLQFNLPDSWPDQNGTGALQPPPLDNSPDESSADERFTERQQAADYRRDSDATRREQNLLGQRYYYVEAIKRVMHDKRLSEPDLRAAAEKLTNRKDRVAELLQRVREPNPRPWP